MILPQLHEKQYNNRKTKKHKFNDLKSKNITQTAVINILKTCILNLTFRMLVNIHFQKIKEALIIQELQPALNGNVSSEKLLLFL